MANEIDLSSVKWDDVPDPKLVKWDDPKESMSIIEKLKKGATDPIEGGAQLLTHLLPDSVVKAGNAANNWLAEKTGLVTKLPENGMDGLIQKNEAEYQDKRKKAGESGFDGYRFLGNVISPTNLAIGLKAPMAATMAGKLGVGAGNGALSSLFEPVVDDNYWDKKAENMAYGAAGGAAAAPVVGALSRIISPKASTNPNIQLLKDEGVRPTIGQLLGGNWSRAEEKLTSFPIVGDAISNARYNATKDFNRAAINRAMSPLGKEADDIGHAGVTQAHNESSKAYEAGKNALGYFQIDPVGSRQLNQLEKMAINLPDTERKQFQNIAKTVRADISPNGHIEPDSFKRIDSFLGGLASDYSGSTSAYEKQLGNAIKEMQSIITENAKRANPRASEMLKNADTAYANLVRVDGAAKAAKNNEGIFTPAQLNAAILQADQSVRKNAVSQGKALMQDLGNAGQSVLGNRVPNSGTVERTLLNLGVFGGGAWANPLIPAGLAGGAAMYSPPVQALLRHLISSRPGFAKPVAGALEQASPMLIPSGAQISTRLMEDK